MGSMSPADSAPEMAVLASAVTIGLRFDGCDIAFLLTGTVGDGDDATCGENGRRALNQMSPGCTLRGVVLVAALLAAGGLGFDAARGEDLQEALTAAYLNNPRLASGRDQLRATDELVPQALAARRPSLFLDGRVEGVTSDTDLAERDNRLGRGVALALRQPLYAGGGIEAGIRRAENQVRAERAFLLSTQQSVLLETVDAYTATWRDRAVLELARINETRLRRQLEATRDRFEVGEVARTDVAQAEARLSRAQADIETAIADLAASTAAYRDVIGIDPGVLVEPQPLDNLPSSEPEAQALAASNPDITTASFNLRAARDNVDVAFADILPSLTLTGDVSYDQQPSQALDSSNDARIGLNLSVPLFQGGADYSRVRQNKQLVSARRNDLENTLRGVQRSVTTAWERVIAARAAIDALESEVRANGIALEGVQEEALVGQRTVLDVLDAENELFVSQVNLVRARREWVLATYQLKSAIGELTVAQLVLPVEPFDEERYYNRVRNRLFGLE